jgi:hypothetical protein
MNLHASYLVHFTKDEDEMGRACSMHGRDKKCIQEDLKGRDHSEDVGINEKIILEGILQKLVVKM